MYYILISLIIGITTFIFGESLLFFIKLGYILFPFNLFLIPIILVCTNYLKLKSNFLSNSMNDIFKSTNEVKKLNIMIVPFQFLSTLMAHFAGASVGREGVAIQLGAVISNKIGTIRKETNLQFYTLFGMACGFSGLFGTPITASIFVFEVSKTKFKINKFLIILIGSFISSITSSLLGLSHFHVNVNFVDVNIIKLIICMVLIIIFGNCFAYMLNYSKKTFKKFLNNSFSKMIILSIILAIFLFTTHGRYNSLGVNLIESSFNQTQIYYFDFVLKSILTISFVSIGFQGGEVTPIFSIGATLGVLLATIFNLPVFLIAAIGYCLMFASVTNAFLASSIMVLEVFSLSLLPFIIPFLLLGILINNKKISIYPLSAIN